MVLVSNRRFSSSRKHCHYRFIVTTEEPYAFQQVAKILKSNGYDKVSTNLAPNFLLRIMSYLDREAKSMRSFVGKTYNGNVSLS